jgi:hypothetical protein
MSTPTVNLTGCRSWSPPKGGDAVCHQRARRLPQVLSRAHSGSSQEAGPPPEEAVGKPVVIDGVQARDVIVDELDV